MLTFGVAADANVVIFERIRDEARLGQSPVVAIDKGFSFALGTIMDANATAFFTALTLLVFGGSQGAHGLNMRVIEALPFLADLRSRVQFTHQTGAREHA